VTLPLSPDAQRACLRALGATAEHIGFDRPLAQYTQAQALHVIDAVIHAYERHLQDASRAVQGLPPLDGFEDDTIPFDHGRDAMTTDSDRCITPAIAALDFNSTSRPSRRLETQRGIVGPRAMQHQNWRSQ
jgi:hypothetical protein